MFITRAPVVPSPDFECIRRAITRQKRGDASQGLWTPPKNHNKSRFDNKCAVSTCTGTIEVPSDRNGTAKEVCILSQDLMMRQDGSNATEE